MRKRGRPFLLWTAGALLAVSMLLPGCAPGSALPGAQGGAAPGKGAAAPLTRVSDLRQVRFLDRSDGWAIAGGKVLRTADGGASWSDVTPRVEGAASITWSGSFLDPATAWVVRNPDDLTRAPVVYRTGDGGRSWSATRLDVPGYADIRFADRRTGWILLHQGAGAGSEEVTLLRSNDGGASWREVTRGKPLAGTTSGAGIFAGIKNGAAFADDRRGWITGVWAGPSILLYRTTDGGATWSSQALEVPAGLSADGGAATSYPPLFSGADQGVLPVLFVGQGLLLYRTRDGGVTWTPSTPVRFASKEGPPQFSLIDPEHVVVTDGADLYRTDDGGLSWATVHPDASLGGIQQLDFVDPSTGWALLPDPSAAQSGSTLLLRTRDGGRSWQPAAPAASR